MHSESMLLQVDAYQLIFLHKHPVLDNIVMCPKRTRMISNANFNWKNKLQRNFSTINERVGLQ